MLAKLVSTKLQSLLDWPSLGGGQIMAHGNYPRFKCAKDDPKGTAFPTLYPVLFHEIPTTLLVYIPIPSYSIHRLIDTCQLLDVWNPQWPNWFTKNHGGKKSCGHMWPNHQPPRQNSIFHGCYVATIPCDLARVLLHQACKTQLTHHLLKPGCAKGRVQCHVKLRNC